MYVVLRAKDILYGGIQLEKIIHITRRVCLHTFFNFCIFHDMGHITLVGPGPTL